MGSSCSTYSEPLTQSTAKVVTLNGSLQEYSVNITVSEVLKSDTTQSCFLCNSDRLYYDECIQALNSNEELHMGQIYFVLPSSCLKSRLTAPDMAALAVKASRAIAKTPNNGSWKRNTLRISPVIDVIEKYNAETYDGNRTRRFDQKTILSKSSSFKKLRRNTSKRTKLANRSFRFRLSTIHEGSVA